MNDPSLIRIEEYNYTLPQEKIAKFPLAERDQSKLLYLSGNIPEEKKFTDLPDLLPANSLLVFNETKVIRARMLFRKETGALIEIFCLEPVEPVNDFQLAFQQTSSVVWKCLVGNAVRWKEGKLSRKLVSSKGDFLINAEMVEKLSDSFLVRFSWEPSSVLFSEIVEKSGLVPLPPYLHRDAVETDSVRYQTVYARFDGSVAAPTAGLHFTEDTFKKLEQKGMDICWLTLHVGAGTFRPVISETISRHEMHTEKIVVSRKTLVQIANKLDDFVIPVGTTSMRTLESLYWMAVKLTNGNSSMEVDQWDPYQIKVAPEFTAGKAFQVLIEFLDLNKSDELKGATRLMIAPGYQFKIAKGLVTNFHQPKSTLLLLVSALIGQQWQEVYHFALQNNFRFLSYGDSCLFLKES